MPGSAFFGACAAGGYATESAYNGDGVRTRKTVGGHTTKYVLDLATTLPVVISDTEAVYLYGLDILAQQEAERLYYFHDGLGSVRQLVDTTGQVDTSYAYDPFGVPVMGGDGSNPYQFTGEAWDAEVELLYLRARYYQPEVGRFITKDPWAGDMWRPSTLNRYVYVTNNPVNYIDPSGLQEPEPRPTPQPTREPTPMATPTPAEPPGPSGVSQLGELFLIVLPDPYTSAEELRSYSEHGYSRRASRTLAYLIVAAWLSEQGPEHQHFGPEYSLTQDVKHSSAMREFRSRWERDARINNYGRYRLPFTWYGHRVEGYSTNTILKVMNTVDRFMYANSTLAACALGQGSKVAEGHIDVVMGIFGSFDDISVEDAGNGLVKFIAHNSMSRASLTRIPVLDISLMKSVKRGWWWESLRWGATTHQYFYWYEANPNGPAPSYHGSHP
jgi:RHS repeat-associated protein